MNWWQNKDPREIYDNIKQLPIVIYCTRDKIAFTGTVETKRSWSVWTDSPNFSDDRQIEADREWPENWYWIKGPVAGEDY